ncbi:hypothetical protein [Phreatobacter cathodiphilus]|uniref:Uncharacterized protein n=1 Tax=Phreatobacter cathodiphilus TaxID=1868589 RepID=A0A2S0NBM1_9HYPH|nr:hypothetical protein [Phreatobacter cathodiphilus]AVO45558.1 hypothetical protein C6569_11045 [Phreatobacter cathodiphilus]
MTMEAALVRLFAMLAFLMPLAAAGAAKAGEGDCFSDDFTAEAELQAAVVRNDGTRLSYVKNAQDQAGCPAAGEACRERAYLVPGNAIIVAKRHEGFRCAIYLATNGQSRTGWLPEAGLMTLPPPLAPDWSGRWRAGREQSITIRRNGATWEIDGDATYGAGDPERMRRGSVNIGSLSATLPRSDRGGPTAVAFTEGPDRTLAYDEGEPTACRVRMQLVGPWLVVSDNRQCGGFNVSFSGIYRRGP